MDWTQQIRRALEEDIGPGDVTTDAVVPPEATMQGRIIAKQQGVVAGLDVAARVKLRAEGSGLSAVAGRAARSSCDTPSPDGKDAERLPDLGPGIRGGKNAYWASFGKDDDWKEKLLEVLDKAGKRLI